MCEATEERLYCALVAGIVWHRDGLAAAYRAIIAAVPLAAL